jgi:ergothioneine biosynthesis protein EgtB
MRVPLAVASQTEAPGSKLAQRYREVRRRTEWLAEPLTPEDQNLQSMPDASPVKWHLAHTSWFFETFLLIPHQRGYQRFHKDFTYLFNSYYNAVGERPERPQRSFMSRPGQEEVMCYRRHVDAAMEELLQPGVAAEVSALVELGLNHEQQHQELILTDIQHAFWSQPLRPTYREGKAEETGESAPLEWVAFPGGIYWVGHEGSGFAFDNEGPRHEVLLQPYELASRLVTNAEYLEFIADGGYRRAELWLSDGWEAVRGGGWQAPLYWIRQEGAAGGEWFEFTLAGVRRLAPHEPVCHVSYYEADAYARWAGARLATEFEWEVAAQRGGGAEGTFLEDERFHPAAAGGKERQGSVQQMLGDCWEWTSSAYLAYPGYRAAEGALGEYNGKFMCNQMVLRGGSCATPRSHIRTTYRNFFPPQARWQFSGIRLAR